MKPYCYLIAAIFSLAFSFAKADASIRLYEWHAQQTLIPLIIPVRSSETPEQAAQRYLLNMERSADLMELFEGRTPDLTLSEFKPLSGDSTSRTLIMANAPKDYTKNSQRLENFAGSFTRNGQKSFLLPIMANLGLSNSETRVLFNHIVNEFPMLVHLGGDDVDPSTYKKENFHAKNTIPARDRFEIALIKAYTSAEKGFLFAVCRGAQITSVALGYKLIQDIPFHIKGAIEHANNWHSMTLLKTKNNLLGDALSYFKTIKINSIHHQAIIFKEGGPLELAGVGPDGITEALEGKNGRILLTQYHPELMDTPQGDAVLNKVVKQTRKLFRAGLCAQQFSF
ncbi:gamma-glutamyl-gamma-aminobutyrate hydrolase family protein [Bdellovibrio sp. HCB2-146]|uniref:gamma-glutamyl-gamma-aminobutyrate hydrolase family protein n=1 Tax=Bdellovibrio sp. HCB2-146 TaxID=3394362 RepID=UPI0039BC4059